MTAHFERATTDGCSAGVGVLAGEGPGAGAGLGHRAGSSLEGIASILDEVEDEFSGVARNPAAWEVDGRLYPPKGDIARPDPAREGVTDCWLITGYWQ